MENPMNFQAQFYQSYLQYCMMNGLNAQDQTNFNKYCQIWMMNNNSGGNLSLDQSNFCFKNENNPKEINPREEKTVYMKPDELTGSSIPPQMTYLNPNQLQAFTGMGNNIINVTLYSIHGLKVVIPAPKTMTFEDLFINFANKAGVPISSIGEKIVFIYKAEKLDPKSKQPICSLFKSLSESITVLDQ